MAFLTAEEIEKIRGLLDLANLEIVLRPDWGSHSPNHREAIHGEMKKRMAKAYPFSDSSISHCRQMGGFVFTSYDADHVLQIGFDVEEDSRVREDVARRVCRKEEEFLRAPSPASLWAAKEAAFKSLKGNHQPPTVLEIELQDWKALDSQFETVRVPGRNIFASFQIQGVLVKKQGFTSAFFVARA